MSDEYEMTNADGTEWHPCKIVEFAGRKFAYRSDLCITSVTCSGVWRDAVGRLSMLNYYEMAEGWHLSTDGGKTWRPARPD